MLNEQQIVEACIQQDRVAQRRLYDLFAGKLYAVALRYMKNRDDAQDVLQDAYVKIYRKIDTFRFDCPLEAWMRKVVVNTALKAIQKNSTASLTDIDEYHLDSFHYNQNMGLENLNMETLLEIINQLPDGSRTVFNLYAIEGYKHYEIAEMLGINEGTSKSQYARAKSLLMEKIEKEKKKLAFAKTNIG